MDYIENCLIQIGLHKSCEYIFVTEKDWNHTLPRFNHNNDIVSLPRQIADGTVWFYYGIDMRQESIDIVSETYRDCFHCEFIKALVYKDDNSSTEYTSLSVHNSGISTVSEHHNYFANYDYNPFGHSDLKVEEMQSTSLDTIILASQYNVKAVVIDVEGAELDILSHFTFNKRPDCFVVESHNMYNTNKLLELMTQQGYSLIARDITNVYRGVPHTDNLTFIVNEMLDGEPVITHLDNSLNYISI